MSVDNANRVLEEIDSSDTETVEDLPFQKKKKREIILKSARNGRTNLSIQQSFCIGLLNNYCDFIINEPPKMAYVSKQFIKVKSLTIGEELIDVQRFLKKRLNELLEIDKSNGISLKTAQRRKQMNKKIDEIHLFQDILRELGFFVVTKKTIGKEGTYRLENIVELWRNGVKLCDEKMIKVFSDDYHNQIMGLSRKHGQIYLKKGTLLLN